MLIPKRTQYKKWSIPSKWSYISGILGLIGFILAIYLGFCQRTDNSMKMEEMEVFANVVLGKILEGSPLCCDIKTAEVVIILPSEKELLLNASMLIGFIPDSIEIANLSFSFSLNKSDSLKIFNCKDVGRKEVDIYFFDHNKVFCSKPAILDLRDPDLNCDL